MQVYLTVCKSVRNLDYEESWLRFAVENSKCFRYLDELFAHIQIGLKIKRGVRSLRWRLNFNELRKRLGQTFHNQQAVLQSS